MSQQKKEFNPEIGLWPSKTGKSYSVFVDDRLLDTLKKVEKGGRLVLMEVSAERREEYPKAPHYRIVFFPEGDEPQQSKPQQRPTAKQADDGI